MRNRTCSTLRFNPQRQKNEDRSDLQLSVVSRLLWGDRDRGGIGIWVFYGNKSQKKHNRLKYIINMSVFTRLDTKYMYFL
nr:hypothetical protein PsAHV6-054 [Psittacid alphaherpesvirus 6]